MTQLTARVHQDDITREISQRFDYAFSGKTVTDIPRFEPPSDFCLGVIVGPSGSGKSTTLRTAFGDSEDVMWDPRNAVVSHFVSADDAVSRLGAVGFGSIPSWLRPHHALSTGEQFRATLARQLDDGALIDEFTSTVDRTVARSCAVALGKYVRAQGLRKVVLATCHYDVIRWLVPDWVYDTRTYTLFTGRWQSRPKFSVDVRPCSAKAWALFKSHHYLSGELNVASRCWLASIGDTPVGFASALAFPNGNFKNAWREHRTVLLPDFQGLGIGVRFSDAVAQMFIESGCRYFSKTAHPRMGAYRNASGLWRPTSKNMKARPDYGATRSTKEVAYKHLHENRVCFSHEYIGHV